MVFRTTFIATMLCFVACLNAQTTLVLQPDAITGRDALLHGLSSQADVNWGTNPQFTAVASTFGGEAGNVRALIEFDLSSIPEGATVESAELSLYAWYSDGGFRQHSTEDGPNSCVLQRVTSPWSELEVTWNTQPSVTSTNELMIAASDSSTQNYLDLDVQALVQDMVDDPQGSHGFMMRLQTESFYRWLNFVSSDDANSDLHPRLVVTYSNPTTVDTCFSLRPDAEAGKDALLHGLSSQVDINWGNTSQMAAVASTFGGEAGDVRAVIDFDLSFIPEGATINQAELSLYAYYQDAGFLRHSNRSGPNTTVLSRITTPWEESTVTWNTQPSITSEGEVVLPATTSIDQNYLNIDVAEMVQLKVDDPANNHGFHLALQTESFYRWMTFVSSDDPNVGLHPKLDVCYTERPVSSDDPSLASSQLFRVSPNPASGLLRVEHELERENTLEIVSAAGQLIRSTKNITRNHVLDLTGMPAGIYFIRLSDNTTRFSRKVILE